MNNEQGKQKMPLAAGLTSHWKLVEDFLIWAGDGLFFNLWVGSRILLKKIVPGDCQSFEEIICKFAMGCQSWSKWPIYRCFSTYWLWYMFGQNTQWYKIRSRYLPQSCIKFRNLRSAHKWQTILDNFSCGSKFWQKRLKMLAK